MDPRGPNSQTGPTGPTGPTGNPIATAIVARAEALAAGAPDRLPPIAADLVPLSRYQQARTLVLTGGAATAEGQSLLAHLHATPMADA